MSLKRLAQFSHLITMLFGVALGMTLSLLYQHMVKIIITDLSVIIIFIVFFSIILRAYTLYAWKKENYNLKFE